MGEGRHDLPDRMAVETGEASVSLDAGKAQLPFVSAIAGKPAIALTVAAAAVVALSDAQIAKIRG